MKIDRKRLSSAYLAIALVALVGTWGNNLAYLERGVLGGNAAFWRDTFANPASRSITVDIFLLALAVIVWMFLEARRLGMRMAWLYVLLGLLVAISVTIPIFLFNRERALARSAPQEAAGNLSGSDLAWITLQALTAVAYTVTTFLR